MQSGVARWEAQTKKARIGELGPLLKTVLTGNVGF